MNVNEVENNPTKTANLALDPRSPPLFTRVNPNKTLTLPLVPLTPLRSNAQSPGVLDHPGFTSHLLVDKERRDEQT